MSKRATHLVHWPATSMANFWSSNLRIAMDSFGKPSKQTNLGASKKRKICHSPGCLTGPFPKQDDDKLMRAIRFLGSQSWGQESTWVTQKMLTSQIFSGMSHKCPLSCLKAWCMIFRNSTVLQPPDIWRPNILFQQLHPKSASNSCYTSIVLSKLGLSKWAKSRSIKSINKYK